MIPTSTGEPTAGVAAGADTVAGGPPPESARCLQCGYALRGLADARCPECGRAFDPHDPSTFRSPQRRRALLQWLALETLPTLCWGAVAVLLALWWQAAFITYDRQAAFAMLIILPLATLARAGVRRWLLFGRPDPRPRSERWARRALCAFAVAWVLPGLPPVSWSCPHGTARGFAHLGIARSATGGPCRNHLPGLRSWHLYQDWYVWVAS